MKRFRITWRGQITDTKFTDDIEAETVDEALQYFRDMHTPHTEIVKITSKQVKTEDSQVFRDGYFCGTATVVFLILLKLIIGACI